MIQADHIRQFIQDRYFSPALASGLSELTLRAGDIHREMRLNSRMPAVCSALVGSKLCALAAVSIKRRRGPAQGANVYVTYDLRTQHASAGDIKESARSVPAVLRKPLIVDPATSLVLVSCVKSKRGEASRARDLYTSTLFQGYKAFATASEAPWFILSAKYGLVHPDEVIAPYEYTLNTLGVAERNAWARAVMQSLLPHTQGKKQIVLLAGARYREFLINPLEQAGLEVLVPMAGLRFGEQLSWLSEHAWPDS